MKDLISILLWAPAIGAKLVLAAVGLIVVPFVHPYKNPIWGNREDPVAPLWFMQDWIDENEVHYTWRERVRDYIWLAIRNPVNNLRYLFEDYEPPMEQHRPWWRGSANPDVSVRTMGFPSAWRYIRHGWFSEFWYLRYSRRFDRFFEFRIGWKFSEVPGFAPTIQLRFGKT